MQVPVWIKPAVWGMVVGSVATMVIGFTSMGWTLHSTALRTAQDRSELAVAAALTPFCVQSFMNQADAKKQLADLRDAASWQQQGIVERGGWATMAGDKEPAPGVALACAQALVKTS